MPFLFLLFVCLLVKDTITHYTYITKYSVKPWLFEHFKHFHFEVLKESNFTEYFCDIFHD